MTTTKMIRYGETKTVELRYGSLIVDTFDAGAVVTSKVAEDMFALRGEDFHLQYATADFKPHQRAGLEPGWDSEAKLETGRFWRLSYRYYPRERK